ncbi:Squamous cell carcinoma antigen recognized by T-cells 3 [Chamberlinius hualienensis]
MEDEDTNDVLSDESDDEDHEVIDKLIAQVSGNPYLYDGHIQLINAVKKIGDLEKLRNAREKMSELFPLTEALWLDWIKDETSLAISKEEKLKICDLYERAAKDYITVDLWVEYAQFAIGVLGDMDNGLEKCRDLFERGIMAIGLNVYRGWLIWEAFRGFELAILRTLEPASEDDEEQCENYEKQKDRIINIFKRQLTVPLFGMELTYKDMLDFVEEVDSNTQLGYNKALAKLGKVLPYEDALASDEPPRLSSYLAYIDYEISEGEPSRVHCLFERAIVENCLSSDLWRKYTEYLHTKLNIESIIIPVYERAVRNCPWSVEIWQGYLRVLEKYGHPTEKIKSTVEKALSSGFTTPNELRQLWMTYLEYLKRQIKWDNEHKEELELLRTAFEKTHSYLTESFGYDGDPQMEVLQYWARVEALHCKNMEKAREIWNDIMQQGHAKYASMWLEFIRLERMFGDAKSTRKTFVRALYAASDWPESIGEAWLHFERDEGTLEQYEAAILKINNRIKAVTEQRQKAEDNSKEKTERSGVGKKKNSKLIEKNVEKKGVKRKINRDDEGKESVDSDGFTVPQAKVAKRSKLEKSKLTEASTSNDKEKPDIVAKKPIYDKTKDDRTVFISNLLFDVTEEQIKEFFSKVGEIMELRLVKDFKGRSKGYGYVEFLTSDLVSNALKQDREAIGGRPVFVSKCKDKKNDTVSKQFKYATGLEKKKLFIRGLPFSLTQEQLVEMFKVYGDLKEARLVTYRNGHSKGIAYVEYNNESDASGALLKVDGLVINEHTISVDISNPPGRKDRETSGQKSDVLSLGGGDRSSGPRSHARTKLSFIPRAVNRTQSNSNESGQSGSAENGDAKNNSTGKPLNNNDFRSMLFN